MLSYLHFPNFDPVIFQISGPAALRWYGFMYAVAFAFGYLGLWWLQRSGYARISKTDVVNYMIAGVLGVFIGGRIGFLVFYEFDAMFLGSAPLGARIEQVFRVWEGGMSFHGGVIGVWLFVGVYARLKKQSFVNLLDCMQHWVPAGIVCVRIANFINGEIFGRTINDAAGNPITDGDKLPWYAMKFPTDPQAMGMLRERGESFVGGNPLPVDPALWAQIEPQIAGRYPVQLAEAALEGLALLILIWVTRRWLRKPGMIVAMGLMGYAAARIPIEPLRQPDPQIDPNLASNATTQLLTALNMTMGQLLCVGMFIVGAVFMFVSWKKNWFGPAYSDAELRYPFQKTVSKSERATAA
ncbi:MAG: prolipoprotein diacylglyceryl transferase [Planctomycetes bacterium]|nr:prolipoprotein diacylglyceryl transferase [Planctomycetota bacterium]